MNLHLRHRPATLLLAAALASTLGTGLAGSIVAAEAPTVDHDCVYYELQYEQARPVVVSEDDALCPSHAAVEAAAAEARGWPNFDPIAIGDRLEAVRAAGIEAAAWPDFDPSDMTTEVAASKAAEVAANWPNFDSTAIKTDPGLDTAANSPRMTQIAATEADNDGASIANAPLDHNQPF